MDIPIKNGDFPQLCLITRGYQPPDACRSLVCDVVEPGVELDAPPREIAAQQWIALREHLQETSRFSPTMPYLLFIFA